MPNTMKLHKYWGSCWLCEGNTKCSDWGVTRVKYHPHARGFACLWNIDLRIDKGFSAHVGMHSHTFDEHVGYLIIICCIKHDKETLVCELSGDIKQVYLH